MPTWSQGVGAWIRRRPSNVAGCASSTAIVRRGKRAIIDLDEKQIKDGKLSHHNPNNGTDQTLSGVLDAALEISRERRETLANLRSALESGNDNEALKLAKELCGLTDEKKSPRNIARVN